MGSKWLLRRMAGVCAEWSGVEWIHLAQDRDWWWALVNMVMNLRILVPQS
jgi:hypothetical protein